VVQRLSDLFGFACNSDPMCLRDTGSRGLTLDSVGYSGTVRVSRTEKPEGFLFVCLFCFTILGDVCGLMYVLVR
jgi:hypothetical protein